MTAPALDMIFFDIDDTLYSTTQFAERARRAAVRAMIEQGLRLEEEEAVVELSEVVAEFTSNYGSHFDRLLDRVGPQRYPGRNRAVLVAAGVVAYHDAKEDGLVLLPDIRSVLLRLYGARVRLGVISAGLQAKQAEKLIRLDAIAWFDPAAIFFSDQMGVSKPNPKIYQKACKEAGVLPRRALYIGDRASHDVVPARAAGLFTVHYIGAQGRHAEAACTAPADHTLADLRDLLPALRNTYGLDV